MKKTVAKSGKKSKSSKSKTLVFMDGETVHVGIDTHKKNYSVTLWSETRQAVLKHWTQTADLTVTIDSLQPFADRIERVVYEAGPCGYGLARGLREAGFNVDVIAPSHTPRSPGQEAKSDRLDSGKLAMWSAKNLLQPVYVPTEEEEADRQVFRLREQMVNKRRRAKQQIKSFLLMHGIEEPEGLANWTKQSIADLKELALCPQLRLALHCLILDLEHFQAQVSRADSAIRALSGADRHQDRVEAQKTVPGVGPITAMAMCAELPCPERFDNDTQVAKMMGLAPMTSQSGQTRREGSLIKGGNGRLRRIIIQAAWRWVAKDPWAAYLFARLTAKTGSKKKAIVAVARRLGIVLWRICVTGEAYRPKPVPEQTAKANKSQPGLLGKNKKSKSKKEAA